MKKIFFALWILTLALACSPRSTPAPAPVSTKAAPVPTVPPLTVDELMNAQVATTTLTDQPLTYQLTDGVFQKTSGDSNRTEIRLLDKMAFGDLNGDNAGDAVAFLAENYGGTGEFISMVVFLNQNGKPVQAAFEPIEDRAVINSVSIDADAVIALDAVIHGVNDPMCCASLESMRHYQLINGQLDMLDFATQTPAGQWRKIDITAPQNGGSVSGSVQITGNVTIAPFENNLAYHILDAHGAELTAGPVPVSAADMGAPGTFDAVIDLSSLPAGTNDIRIEIQDQSAADGSLLAMDSVNVSVK